MVNLLDKVENYEPKAMKMLGYSNYFLAVNNASEIFLTAADHVGNYVNDLSPKIGSFLKEDLAGIVYSVPEGYATFGVMLAGAGLIKARPAIKEISEKVRDYNNKENRNSAARVGKSVLISAALVGTIYALGNSLLPIGIANACPERYTPNSKEAKELFKKAAKKANLPEEWAESKSLHYILHKESKGCVGIPNYSIKAPNGKPAKYFPRTWKNIHNRLKRNLKGSPDAKSTATGLGQLILSNTEKYYPSGKNGIGDAHEEAVGMLRYIRAKYGSPNTAKACFGKLKPKKCPWKTFKEGY